MWILVPTPGFTLAEIKAVMAELPTVLGGAATLVADLQSGVLVQLPALIVERDRLLAGMGWLRERLKIANARFEKLTAVTEIGCHHVKTEKPSRRIVGGLRCPPH